MRKSIVIAATFLLVNSTSAFAYTPTGLPWDRTADHSDQRHAGRTGSRDARGRDNRRRHRLDILAGVRSGGQGAGWESYLAARSRARRCRL